MNTWFGSVLIAAALVSAGCGAPASSPVAGAALETQSNGKTAALPQEKADIEGPASKLTRSDKGTDPVASVLVEEVPGEQTGNKLLIRIQAATPVFIGSEARPGSAADLKDGQKLRVWITGPVAMSYPGQATAAAVMIVSP